ncbi:MAG: transcription termination factor NusA [Oscillospiraceae bacterium]|nr:transcription termination factor NusA [Oscillospiraceae bacterium]
MSSELFMLLEVIEQEKGISREVVLEALESALVSAYKRNFGPTQNIGVRFDEETGEIKIIAQKTVVEDVEMPDDEISLDEAKVIKKTYKLGDIVEFEVTPADFGRIAAQTARQVVLQRIREAEREKVYDEYSEKTNEIVSAVVKRIDRRNVVVEIGNLESILMPNEQSNLDRYVPGERLKLYVVEVANSVKGVHLVVSRSHPMLVRKLFELEIPEIEDGIIEIKGLTREAGSRTKIAVMSNDSDVEAVGTCIGPRGMRVQKVIDELRGEKIDIVKYSDDPGEFVTNALSPAKVTSVDVDEEAKVCNVKVPNDQLSLAIGKEGQNARLAARLTNWKIDIKGE